MTENKLQREANDLDLDMYRTVGRLLAFAEMLPRNIQGSIQQAAAELSGARSAVRAHMHPARRKETAFKIDSGA